MCLCNKAQAVIYILNDKNENDNVILKNADLRKKIFIHLYDQQL